MQKTYSVVIVDDHDGVRKGIKRLIEKGGEFEVVGEARNGKQALQVMDEKVPDLVILDVKLPLLRGEEVAKRLTTQYPEIKIIALSSYDNPQYIIGMIENGASAYLTKDEAPKWLKKAAKDILSGHAQHWMSEDLMKLTGVDPLGDLSSSITLSRIEYQILQMLRKDVSQEEIARRLDLPFDRLERYIELLLMKFQVKSTLELKKLG